MHLCGIFLGEGKELCITPFLVAELGERQMMMIPLAASQMICISSVLASKLDSKVFLRIRESPMHL
jgi:hypothetical protein